MKRKRKKKENKVKTDAYVGILTTQCLLLYLFCLYSVLRFSAEAETEAEQNPVMYFLFLLCKLVITYERISLTFLYLSSISFFYIFFTFFFFCFFFVLLTKFQQRIKKIFWFQLLLYVSKKKKRNFFLESNAFVWNCRTGGVRKRKKFM